MRDSRIDAETAAPPQVVWAVVCDVERWPEWTASMSSIRLLDPGPLAAGSRAAVVQPKLKPATWRVTEFDEQRMIFTSASSGPGVVASGMHVVEPRGTGSRATLSLHFAGMLG